MGHDPAVILAGRGTNDGMGAWIADQLHERRGRTAGTALILGLTFKENVPDLRNSRSFDVARRLRELGHDVALADPIASAEELKLEHGIDLADLGGRSFDLVVGAVAHRDYRDLATDQLSNLVAPGGTLADIKAMWRERKLADSIDYWTL
jgi:UDP-N-acetyl-D-galactosamine dehydrogenase